MSLSNREHALPFSGFSYYLEVLRQPQERVPPLHFREPVSAVAKNGEFRPKVIDSTLPLRLLLSFIPLDYSKHSLFRASITKAQRCPSAIIPVRNFYW